MSRFMFRQTLSSRVRPFVGAVALVFSLLSAGQVQAQYVWDDLNPEIPQHLKDFQKWIDDQLEPIDDHIKKLQSGYYDPRPGAMIPPRVGSQNPQGKLLAAFRLGPIQQFQAAEVNGLAASPKLLQEAKLVREGSLLEFYEDGTFLRVRNGHVATPGEFGTCRGTYTRTGNRIAFRAYASGSGPYQTITESVRGEIVLGPNGTAQAVIDEEIHNFGSVSFRGQLVNQWNNKFRLRYGVGVRVESPEEAPRVAPVPPGREGEPPVAEPDQNVLVGHWYRTCVLPDGREGIEILGLYADGNFGFILAVDEGRQLAGKCEGTYQFAGGTLRLVQTDGRPFVQGSIQVRDARSFIVTYPNGTRHLWLRVPQQPQQPANPNGYLVQAARN